MNAHDPANNKSRESIISRAVNWLRAGYPKGVYLTDAVPVSYVLRRHLNDHDIEEIFARIVFAKGDNTPLKEGVITREDIHWFVKTTAGQEPNDEEIRRVQDRLRRGGFPLEEDA